MNQSPPHASLRRPPLPRWTIRLRLTLLYGGVFLASGVVLLGITYALVDRATGDAVFIARQPHRGSTTRPATLPGGVPNGKPVRIPIPNGKHPFRLPTQTQAESDHLRAFLDHQHASDLHQLLIQSAIALAGMAFLSLALGWLVAGRALRPLRTMTAAAQRITQRNLHERLAVQGPADELKDLGDTVDELLARLEAAFEAQRRFVANASHELRTPLTLGRALLEDQLADPRASTGSFRATSQRLLEISEEQERLIAALLTLASSERGLEERVPVDLADIVDQIVSTRHAESAERALHVSTSLEPAPVWGDAQLLQRLVANLFDNALRHNVPAGSVDVATGTANERALLYVANTGPLVPQSELARLFQPFQRLATDRTEPAESHGLGLSIVQAIATAHNASLTARARPEGGLTISVDFLAGPPRADSSEASGLDTGNATALSSA
ncbi:MAG TPA: HAMP domain-containing sensor histidine kinase [Gaiellaceae bacterium]|nr:HAMP domain-containing sensor histidine kinase [Gaiellaceae bacterium]